MPTFLKSNHRDPTQPVCVTDSFVYLLLTIGTPFRDLVKNFASLLTAVNALSFKQESVTKSEHFLDFIKP